MGRRALPKIDRSIDFSNHILEVDSLEPPFDPQSLFESDQDLEIEVGSGKGHFVLTHSGANPDRNYLGNEIAKKYARFGAYRLAKHGRTNARILRGDGLKLFRELLPDACAVDVHVYFPDPWWKDRHRQRRVIQPQFVEDLQRVLKPGGFFHFWTDVEQYFEEAFETLAPAPELGPPIMIDESPADHDMDYRTHFERRMRLNGHDVFRAKFERK